MPTYDYRCSNCGTLFQARHAMDAARPDCPCCGGAPARVTLSAPAVHGFMAQGREAAVRTFEKQETAARHGPGCPCCHR